MEGQHSPGAEPGGPGFAFLLVQLGTLAARQFAAELAPLGVEPRHIGMLTRLAANEGKTQQAVGELIGLTATQMVFLVDDLERLGFVERRRNPVDRRSYGLYLTGAGRDLLVRAQAVGAAHQDRLGSSLSQRERDQLTGLLRKLARAQGLTDMNLPGAGPRPR